MELQYCISIYLLIMSIVSFVMFYLDKQKARKHKWRISESSLIGVAALGGAIGAWLAMQLFHHKTKHPKFYIGIPLLVVIWLFAISAGILFF